MAEVNSVCQSELEIKYHPVTLIIVPSNSVLKVTEFFDSDGKELMSQAMHDSTLERIRDSIANKQREAEKHINVEKATKWLRRYMRKIRKLSHKQELGFLT